MRCTNCSLDTDARPCSRCDADPRLRGRYELLVPLGEGGCGATWLGVDALFGNAVAVKQIALRPGGEASNDDLETRVVALLTPVRHAGLPVCHDVCVAGSSDNRALYVVQERVVGDTLEDALATRAFTPTEVLRVALEVLALLEHLHELPRPIFHGDIKPANLTRRADTGCLALLDLGFLRAELDGQALGGHAASGTFGYMSPEQFSGELSPSTDLYALGATLIHLLSQVSPWELRGPDMGLDWVSSVSAPPQVRSVLLALLNDDPRRRPASASQAAALVRRALAQLDALEPAPEARAAEEAEAAVGAPVTIDSDWLEPLLTVERRWTARPLAVLGLAGAAALALPADGADDASPTSVSAPPWSEGQPAFSQPVIERAAMVTLIAETRTLVEGCAAEPGPVQLTLVVSADGALRLTAVDGPCARTIGAPLTLAVSGLHARPATRDGEPVEAPLFVWVSGATG